MTKSPAEILLFLTIHSSPEYYEYPLIKEDRRLPKTERLSALLLQCAGTTRYKCPSKSLEGFLGEPISFERHLRPLMELGALHFSDVDEPGSFYDSPSYRKAFDSTNGQVKDYKSGESWVAFHFRENNFLDHAETLEKEAESLGLFKGLAPKKLKSKKSRKV